MKIRLDPVTNSSTASYTVGVHGELTKEMVLEAFGVPGSSPLYQFAEDLASLVVDEAEEITKDDILEDCGGLSDAQQLIFDSGMTCYIGEAGSDGNMVEQMLCYHSLHYESDDLIIDAGGY